VASYPRQIPAGGEGKISIKVNTSGYGGRTLKKSIDVFTNDPAKSRITLSMTGNVVQFASLKPTFARLVGEVGTDIKKTITIMREKDYPFKIIDVRARNGKDIAFDLKELNKADGDGYVLTVENRKTATGRYTDSLILTTDSTVKPIITVRVYGQIYATQPASKNAPGAPLQKKSNNG
jgi:hypothetical protein